jgi:gamma-glutamyl:cysteine ligase YbdK (ATP-grasp superfamily)
MPSSRDRALLLIFLLLPFSAVSIFSILTSPRWNGRPELLQRLGELAAREGLHIQTHISESDDQVRIRDRSRRHSPVPSDPQYPESKR